MTTSLKSPVQSTINSSMGLREWTMLIVLSVLWGGSFFFIGVAVTELSPLTIVTIRVGLAAIVLWGIALMMGLTPPQSIKVWLAFLGMGLLNNMIPFVLIVWGQTHIASGLAAILNAATPMFTVIVAGMLLPDERFSLSKILGVVIGFVGVIVMIGIPDLFTEGNFSTVAQLAVLAAALSYAFAGVYGRRFKAMGVNPVVAAAGQVSASALVMLPIAFILDPSFRALFDSAFAMTAISSTVWLAMDGLAVLSTAVAYLLYFKLLESSGATNLLLVTLLIPVSAIVLGALYLNESLETVHYVGMLLIALGLSAIDGRLWRWTA